MRQFRPFNISYHVRVRLTPAGIRALREEHDDLNALSRGFLGPFRPPDVDADGYTVFQLWDLMNRLGRNVSMGGENMFDPAIEIEIVK